MRVPIVWLEEIIGSSLDPNELAERLTLAGLEIEEIIESEIGPVLDLAITPNRGDCLSMLGLAYELSALYADKLDWTPPQQHEVQSVDPQDLVAIEETQACTRYCGALMSGVRVGPAPEWMSERLEAAGIRSINNVVDITNYVLLEQGQPLHAFDAGLLQGKGVHVRFAQPAETIITLDGAEQKLDPTDLVIADAQGPVALAGVMGGQHSEVSEKTKRLFLESAAFQPGLIRKTSKRLGIQSESSYRFERGIDWYRVRTAFDRMVVLLQEHAGAQLDGEISDVFTQEPKPTVISFDPTRVSRLIGGRWTDEQIETPLLRLGCTVGRASTQWSVSVPSRRYDLKESVDLIEEVVRLRGYETVLPQAPRPQLRVATSSLGQGYELAVKRLLAQSGFRECIHYSFTSQETLRKLGASWEEQAPVLANPLSNDLAVLRSHLLPSLLNTLQYHHSRQMTTARLFELRTTFAQGNDAVVETKRLTAVMSGIRQPQHWSESEKPNRFYEIKGVVEQIASLLGIENKITFTLISDASRQLEIWHPHRSSEIYLASKLVGTVGELHPALEARFDLKGPVTALDLDWDFWVAQQKDRVRYQPFSKLPWIQRDLAVVVDDAISSEAIEAIIKEESNGMASKLLIFDVYRGDQVPEGKKSIAYRYQFFPQNDTLTDAAVEEIQQKIIESLKKKLQADIR